MKGNGKYKIAPIYEQFEISQHDAREGDLVIYRATGMWSRIRSMWNRNTAIHTTHGDVASSDELMFVRY